MTRSTYKSGQNRYLLFCKLYHITNALPVNEQSLCYFITHLGEEGLAHGTIKSYLSAVRYLQISYGFPSPFEVPMPRLELILRGIKSTQAKQGRIPKRKLPITPIMLQHMRAMWSRIGTDYEETMLWAAAVTCFFGFMRAGEVLLNAKDKFDPSYNLSFADVASDSRSKPSFIQLTLKGSKTDPFRKGVNIIIGRTGDRLCPVEALFKFLMLRGNKDGPLFLREDGSPLTKPLFIQKVRDALKSAGYHDVDKYAGHSFRAGAATTAAAMGVQDSLIKMLGRWESLAYLLYIRIPREELQSVSSILARYQ